MTSFGPHWPSACESPAPAELLVEIAADKGVVITREQAAALLDRVDGFVLEGAGLLDRMIAAHERRHGSTS